MLNKNKQVKLSTFISIASTHCFILFYLNDLRRFNVVTNLTALYEAWHKPGEAEEWLAKLPQTEGVEAKNGSANYSPELATLFDPTYYSSTTFQKAYSRGHPDSCGVVPRSW